MKTELKDVSDFEMTIFLEEIVEIMMGDYTNTIKSNLLNELLQKHEMPYYTDLNCMKTWSLFRKY